jgi:translation initiation factor RLI1
MEKVKRMDDTEIMVSGIEILNKALGVTNTLRFLSLLHDEPTDYVEISQRLYDGQTIEEIFDRAKKHWKD